VKVKLRSPIASVDKRRILKEKAAITLTLERHVFNLGMLLNITYIWGLPDIFLTGKRSIFCRKHKRLDWYCSRRIHSGQWLFAVAAAIVVEYYRQSRNTHAQ
jgi:hypothetical protein